MNNLIVRELQIIAPKEELQKAISIASEGMVWMVQIKFVGEECIISRYIESAECLEELLPISYWDDIFSALYMMDWSWQIKQLIYTYDC